MNLRCYVYCSLECRTLLLSPVTCTTGCCFRFGSISSFFLELFLHFSPVAYWAPAGLVSSALSITSFHTVHGILKARILNAVRMLKYNKTHNTFLNKYTLLKTELFNESKVNNAFLSIPDHFPF